MRKLRQLQRVMPGCVELLTGVELLLPGLPQGVHQPGFKAQMRGQGVGLIRLLQKRCPLLQVGGQLALLQGEFVKQLQQRVADLPAVVTVEQGGVL